MFMGMEWRRDASSHFQALALTGLDIIANCSSESSHTSEVHSPQAFNKMFPGEGHACQELKIAKSVPSQSQSATVNLLRMDLRLLRAPMMA